MVGSANDSSSAVRNEWSYTSTPSICLHSVDRASIKFTFKTLPLRVCRVGGGGPVYMQLTLTKLLSLILGYSVRNS